MDPFAVQASWYRAFSADINIEARTVTGTHAAFTLPTVPEPAGAAPTPSRFVPTAGTINSFFGSTHPRAAHESQHVSHPSLDREIPPPPYADVELPAYSEDPNAEPITLAMYLFKFGFLFPPFWILGTIILISPLAAPADFERSKSEAERQQAVQIMRRIELKWARRCAWALFALLLLAGLAAAITIAVLKVYS